MALCLVSAPAAAHAILVESWPAKGSVVKGAELEVELRFNSRIDWSRSRLTLVLPDHAERILEIVPDGRAELLRAKAEGLTPGNHRIHWQVLSVDGHITRGDVPFTIEP